MEGINQPFAIWIMGPTSSGKTTLSEKLVGVLRSNDVQVMHFDGDEVRNFFPEDMGFRPEDRLRVVDTICHLANKCVDAGVNVVVSALTANENARNRAFSCVKNLAVVYIDCPIETCMQRDPKGLYKKAAAGEIDTLAGYNTPYEAPARYEIGVDTSVLSPDQAVQAIIEGLAGCRLRNPA
ncbi:adenylyl-sulfate kinase [Pseudodesulfovibrio portus]|uniref:Adenylyl-sulfate kinase n=1 Tax=Pseudodesulfovibrio portus TaxID=231439 RepID=A0ABN6RXF0_9BACT|nr:adenylyl-sulfate kinase [Pseudodesulfovibrio portus]BDQ34712.1 adenylyl-sulfate kinase [Pseudodesulfovibrio portus]